MPTCREVHGFLAEVAARTVTAPLSVADAGALEQAGLIRQVSAEGYQSLNAEVHSLANAQLELERDAAQRAGLAAELRRDETHTHSILFHFHGKEKQATERREEEQTRTNLQAADKEFAARQQAFNELVAKRSLFDGLTAWGSGYVGLTPAGAIELRNLGVRLYRVGDAPFDAYRTEALRISQRLEALSAEGATYFAQLAPSISGVDRSYLWAVSLGLAKVQPDPPEGVRRFAEAWNGLGPLGHNAENRLMASEILFALPGAPSAQLPALGQLVADSRRAGVAGDSALGVGAILLYGRRADGSFATENLAQFLQRTRSFESAALLAITNVPTAPLAGKFDACRSLFRSWGYGPSEDTELASAYLAVSEVPVEGISTKLSIIARGLTTYLQYPLVAAAVLASVSTLEANETLNLLEQAYSIVGRRTAGMPQAEILTLAVRAVEGIRNELLGALDATAARPPTVAPPVPGPRPFFLPIVVAHYGSYATFGGLGGAHPGHVHGFGGVGGGGFG